MNIATGYVGGQFIDALGASCDGNVAGITGSPSSSCGNTTFVHMLIANASLHERRPVRETRGFLHEVRSELLSRGEDL